MVDNKKENGEMKKKDVKIVVVAHKKAVMPEDEMYVPVYVGENAKELRAEDEGRGFIDKDGRRNIATRNPFYSELTALYWAWNNLDAKYVGLVHYRRFFSMHNSGYTKELSSVLSQAECDRVLAETYVVLPKKRHYIIETMYSHYAHTLYVEPLDATRDIIADMYPEYLASFDRLKERRSGHMFNMFIMRKDIMDMYCEWLFSILFALEDRVDAGEYNQFHARLYGRISEVLLDVFLETRGIPFTEMGYIYTEKMNVLSKVRGFLAAKFLGKKYDRSA